MMMKMRVRDECSVPVTDSGQQNVNPSENRFNDVFRYHYICLRTNLVLIHNLINELSNNIQSLIKH